MSKATNKCYDVLIIGAGIQGVGIAQACALQGWKVALLEKAEEVATGTSSKSSKLIHGGLRYLETLQFSLVKECLRERRILCEIAPELVKLQSFYLPIYKNNSRHAWTISLGLSLYSLLSSKEQDSDFYKHSIDKASELGLSSQNLSSLFEYYDAQTDDRLLTRAVADSAIDHGAEFMFKQQVKQIKKHNDLYYVQTDKNKNISCRFLINAGGPWINKIAELCSPPIPTIPIAWVKGSHIVINKPAPQHCFYVESPSDQRPVFILPWYGKLLIGTTESKFSDDPDELSCNEQETDYLLSIANHYLPSLNANKKDVCDSFAGLRVLPSDNKNANKKARDTQIIVGENYFAVYGGKLTAYRTTAEKVAKQIHSLKDEQKIYKSSAKVKL